MELIKSKLMPVIGKVQHYAWGGNFYLPELLKIPAKPGETYAEYWLGAHPGGSATLFNDKERILLSDYIKAFPQQTLGEKVYKEFGTLPYLLKILDVKQMLSIQVHPSKGSAKKAFAEENGKGIALTAPNRNYKDDNHKPELMMALSEFWLLHGFKPQEALERILSVTPELKFLTPVFRGGDYKKLYQFVMQMDQAEVNRHLQPLVDRVLPLYESGSLGKSSEDFWAARAALTYQQNGNQDRGIFSIYFFNLVRVQPGGAVFQDAGLPHAYLEGQNVEIMANSDNVLRGGLTPKHVDVPELMKHTRFEATIPRIIPGLPVQSSVEIFPTPAPDFELGLIRLAKGETLEWQSASVQLFIVLEGKAELKENDGAGFSVERGGAWISFDGAWGRLKAVGDLVVYRGAVGNMD
ncbi:MAG TPA: mannose-6-phosphate isomerase, class I [Puia sp.]|nr:mannose-6-phosphate isomerase, class I [Puia sp.]